MSVCRRVSRWSRAIRSVLPGVVISAIAVLAAGCGAPETRDTDVRLASLPEFQTAADRGAVLLDVRSAEAFAAGHVPGAVNVPLPAINASLRTRITPDREVVVYAEGGLGVGTAAAKKLIHLGYANVSEFRGGYEAWQSASDDGASE